MEIFRELNKKGYKHYYGGTIEELDSMDKNNPDLHSEIMQVLMWLYEKHEIWIVVNTAIDNTWYFELYNLKDKRNAEIVVFNDISDNHNSPTEAYEAAIKYCLTELI